MKILLFDIETSPNLAFVWGKYQQDVIAYQDEWQLLSWCAKWLGGKTITRGLDDYQCSDDRELVTELWELFNEADIIIGHNGDKFDIKKCNTRFIEHGLLPPEPYKTIDTLKIARRYFAFNSNRLDDLGRRLGVGRKVETGGFKLWLGCMNNDPRSWYLMKKYNRQDVLLLEEVYLKLRPWLQNHPFTGGACDNCGGSHFQKRGIRKRKSGKQVQSMQCQDCGAWTGRKL